MPADKQDELVLPRSSQMLVIWCLLDNRAGHENQVLGLAEALARQTPVKLIRVPLNCGFRGFGTITPWTTAWLTQLPKPELVIGAGHRSHIPLLVAARQFGGKSIVLMKPSLPMRFFDYCVVSDSDHVVRSADGVLLTRGVLNRIQPTAHRDPRQGLILIGGPSKHFQWSDQPVFEQVLAVVNRTADIQWRVATSRRTPAGFLKLCTRHSLRAEIIQPNDVDSSWLPTTIARVEYAWVTQDSMSMTFEALTAGCRVGMIELACGGRSRVTDRAIRLADSGDVTRWSDWSESGHLNLPQTKYREADCCAEIILERLGTRQFCRGKAG